MEVKTDPQNELDSLKEQVRSLAEAVQLLTAKVEALTPVKAEEAIPEEIVQVIAAAIGAYLGKRATVKFIRPVQNDPENWAVQGRVAIQGSHQQQNK